MSESTASKDSFALFAEFMRWKESQESSRNSSVPSGGVGDSGTQVEVQSSSKCQPTLPQVLVMPVVKETVLAAHLVMNLVTQRQQTSPQMTIYPEARSTAQPKRSFV